MIQLLKLEDSIVRVEALQMWAEHAMDTKQLDEVEETVQGCEQAVVEQAETVLTF